MVRPITRALRQRNPAAQAPRLPRSCPSYVLAPRDIAAHRELCPPRSLIMVAFSRATASSRACTGNCPVVSSPHRRMACCTAVAIILCVISGALGRACSLDFVLYMKALLTKRLRNKPMLTKLERAVFASWAPSSMGKTVTSHHKTESQGLCGRALRGSRSNIYQQSFQCLEHASVILVEIAHNLLVI